MAESWWLHRSDLRVLMRWAGSVMLVASVAFIAERLWRLDWSGLAPHFSWKLGAAAVVASVFFTLADQGLAKAWTLLADPEKKLSASEAVRIYGQGVLLKYLPGSVFQYVGRQLGGVGAGLTHGQLVRSSAAEIGLHVVASICVAAACLLLTLSPTSLLVAMAVFGVTCVTIRRPLVTALALQTVAFGSFAIAAAVVALVVLPSGTELAHFSALFLLAWLAGFVVPAAPGGLGVREAALLALAGSSLPTAALLATILALRVASIAGDLAYGLLAVWWGRLRNP